MTMDEGDFDALLDAFKRGPDDPVPEWALKDGEDISEQLEKCPFFMTKLPDNIEDHPQLQALQALLYDGTPEEIAKNFKEQGNDAYKLGSKGYQDALTFYTKGLDQRCTDDLLNSQLFNNRAAVNLALQNWGDAARDAARALLLDRNQIKAYWRAARATLALGKVKEAASFVEQGLKVDANNKELTEMKDQIEKKKAELEKEEQQRSKRLQQTKQFEQLMNIRGVKYVAGAETRQMMELGGAQLFGSNPPKVSLDPSTRKLVFPVVFLYPPYSQFDFVEKVNELHTFSDHLSEMFPPSIKDTSLLAPWDSEKIYYRPSGFKVYIFQNGHLEEDGSVSDETILWRVNSNTPVTRLLGSVIKAYELGILFVYVLPASGDYADKFEKKFGTVRSI